MTTTTMDVLGNLAGKLVDQVEPKYVLERLGLERPSSSPVALLGPLAALGTGMVAGAFAKDLLVTLGLRHPASKIPGVLAGIGVLAMGGVLGAGLGMAFAPTSGREFRQMVTKRFEEGRKALSTGDEPNADDIAARNTKDAGSTSPTPGS